MKKSLAILLAVIVMIIAVVPVFAVTEEDLKDIKVAVVMPSTKDDYAFSQSMYESLIGMGFPEENIAISESLGDATAAEEAIRDYAEDYDLVIAHGSQYGAKIQTLAADYPETVFAWGNGVDTYGQPNVYAYKADAEQGGYVFGQLAALQSESGVLGICGPVDSGDAHTYAAGFTQGAIDAGIDPANIKTVFTGSFGDVSLMSDCAKAAIDEGADILTGSSQAVPGAIKAVEDADKIWLGVQYDTSPIAPTVVLADIVYDWSPMLWDILNNREKGVLGGQATELTFENGGLNIRWNDENFEIPEGLKEKMNSIADEITAGTIDPLPAE